jgi:hypothetical protein
MNAMIITVLLTVMQAAPPMPRQAPDSTTHAANEIRKNPAANQTPSTQVPSSLNTTDSKTNQNTGNQPSPENAIHSIRVSELPAVSVSRDWIDILAILFTGILVIVGSLGVCAAYRTLKAIETQVLEMAQQRAVMRRQTRHIARQARSMRYQTTHLKNAVIQARRAAKAAKLSADMAVGVSVPTLVIEGFEIADVGAANLAAMIQYPKIKITVRNYGQTPALLKWWTIIFTCEGLPDVPVYGRGIVLEKIVIKPDASHPLPQLPFSQRQEISLDDALAVINYTKTLTAYGYICYGDVFGNPLRRFKFCEMALNVSESGGIQWVSNSSPSSYQGIDQLPLVHPAPRK